MAFTFTKATKSQARARIALIGPSGSGKTYTALLMAKGLGKRIAVIDTENGSASKYAGDLAEFDVLNLGHHDPATYVEAIHAAESAGYDVIIIDSLSHAWAGSGGALEQVDNAAKRYKGNSYAAWRDVTPKHNALVNALVSCSAHLIVTMRAKTAYELQKDDRGKVAPVKIGLAPVQRDGVEYEFDIVADMDLDHNLLISKTRMSALDGVIQNKPGESMGQRIAEWLSDGDPAAPPAAQGELERSEPTPGNGRAPAKTQPAPDPESHYTERIESAKSVLELVAMTSEIRELTNTHHRTNSLAMAMLRAIELSTTPDDLAMVRDVYKEIGKGLNGRKDEVIAAAKAKADEIEPATEDVVDAETAAAADMAVLTEEVPL